MSLLQELHNGRLQLQENLKITESTLNNFLSKSGLDLGDCLYLERCFKALKYYVKTRKIDNTVKGFDYSHLIDKGYYPDASKKWIKKHYYKG